MTTPEAAAEPLAFRNAVNSMHLARVRQELELGTIRPPQRLAPYSYALGIEVRQDDSIIPTDSDGSAFGRLILLYDPEGHDAWNGTHRLVAFIHAEVDATIAHDHLLPEVAWSWLHEELNNPAHFKDGIGATALGGTVTSTSSVRFGDIAGPPRAHQLELRASWTAVGESLAEHVEAFCAVLGLAAGLPPDGITALPQR